MRRVALPIAALLVASIVFASRRWLERGAPTLTPRPAAVAPSSGAPATVAPLAADPQRTAAPDPAVGSSDASTDAVAPRAKVQGVVSRRSRGTARLAESGTVVVSYVDFALHGLSSDAYAALDEAARIELHSFEEAPIDPSGRFAFELPFPGAVRHFVVRPDLTPGNAKPQFLETDNPIDEERLTLEAPRAFELFVDAGAAIEGVVVDADGGAPLADARVMAPWWNDTRSDWSCVTDHEGRFRIVGIRPEIASTDSWSELVVERAGYVAARFAAPPEGEEGDDEDFDLEGLRLSLSSGVTVEVLLLPPTGIDVDALRRWQAEMERADLSLRPRPSDATAPVAVVAWVARPLDVVAEGAARRVTFPPIPPTTDVELNVSFSSGRCVPPIALDASAPRTTASFPIAIPDDASPRPQLTPNDALFLRLLTPDGRPLGQIEYAVEEPRLERLARGTARTSADARGSTLRPFPGRTLSLRVAGFATVHVTGIDDRRFDGPLELRLVPLPSAR